MSVWSAGWKPSGAGRQGVLRSGRLALGGVIACLCLLTVALLVAARLRAPGLFTGTVGVGVIPSSIALDPGVGHAFVVNSGSDSVSVLDMHSGDVVRTTRVGHNPIAVEVDPRTHRAFVLNNADGTITTLDTASGVPLAVSAPLHAKDLVLDEQRGYVYVAGWDQLGGDGVAVLDARSGRLLHRIAAAYPRAVAVDPQNGRLLVTNTATNELLMVDDRGRTLQVLPAGVQPSAVAVAALGKAFIAHDGDDLLTILDIQRSRPLGSLDLGAGPVALAMDERVGRLYVETDDGRLRIVDARGDRPLRTLDLGGRPPEAVGYAHATTLLLAGGRHRLFALSWRTAGSGGSTLGRVMVMDTNSGRVLRTVPAGAEPLAMALDERSGRLFVVNGGTTSLPASGTSPGWLPDWLRRWLPRHGSSPATAGLGSVTVLYTTGW